MKSRSTSIVVAVVLLALAPLAADAQAATVAAPAQGDFASRSVEPQRHVGAVIENFARKDYEAAASEAHAIGRKLASGGAWARGELARGFDSLDDSWSRFERSFESKSRASPLDVGA
ncbi:MAG: hypothetical protein KF755_00855 [Burkholderiaceae bacterium]|nr:hypothetical protein [Burkholderiaceae bacterium]